MPSFVAKTNRTGVRDHAFLVGACACSFLMAGSGQCRRNVSTSIDARRSAMLHLTNEHFPRRMNGPRASVAIGQRRTSGHTDRWSVEHHARLVAAFIVDSSSKIGWIFRPERPELSNPKRRSEDVSKETQLEHESSVWYTVELCFSGGNNPVWFRCCRMAAVQIIIHLDISKSDE